MSSLNNTLQPAPPFQNRFFSSSFFFLFFAFKKTLYFTGHFQSDLSRLQENPLNLHATLEAHFLFSPEETPLHFLSVTRHFSNCLFCFAMDFFLKKTHLTRHFLLCLKENPATYTSLFEVYFLSKSASGAIHLTGKRPCNTPHLTSSFHISPHPSTSHFIQPHLTSTIHISLHPSPSHFIHLHLDRAADTQSEKSPPIKQQPKNSQMSINPA